MPHSLWIIQLRMLFNRIKDWRWMFVLVAVVATMPAVIYLLDDGQDAPSVAPSLSSNTRARTIPRQRVATSSAQLAAAPALPSDSVSTLSNPDGSSRLEFKVAATGKIVTDEAARLNLEKLYALYTSSERAQKIQELQATLPPSAAQQLTELLQQYSNYQTAAYQVVPPGREFSTEAEALIDIDTFHALRVQYFGSEVAKGFFEEDEKMQRELLHLMSIEKDQSLTTEEKADRSQALYKTLHTVNAAIDRDEREAQAAQSARQQ